MSSKKFNSCYSNEKQCTPSSSAPPKWPHQRSHSVKFIPALISGWVHSLWPFYLELGEDDFESLWTYGLNSKDWWCSRPFWDSFFLGGRPDQITHFCCFLEKSSEYWSMMGPTSVACYEVGHYSDHWSVVKKLPLWRCGLMYFHCSSTKTLSTRKQTNSLWTSGWKHTSPVGVQ